ncbi:WH2 domain-containing protein [Endozoicomonas sp. YOMI1]|uniref:WH2 domain-containing protein n=1 Tax=Endozoicomonas sp. YOMI1 TaxID=2828739 RepID=UPI002147AB6F|nr:WH2 domain-containing protein [Endozoicomonas sp. YOMI1]
MDSQRISPPSLDQIKIPEQKPAKYAGIESGKGTKILDSDGKLVSTWGRKIENFFDIERINPKRSEFKKAMHEFQELMTNRRVKLLQEVEDTSTHIDNILNLPESIQNHDNYVNRKKFTKLVQSDVKKYLSYEIRCCNSGQKLVKLYEEVQRLRDHHRLPPKIIEPLFEKINDQMAVLVEEMPKHLRSIDHDKEKPQTLELTKKKCEVVKGLLSAASKINDNLHKKHRKALRNMMVVMFSEDVEKVTSLCKARNNLKENEKLSDDIKEVRDTIVYPFFEGIASDSEEYCKKVERNTDKQIKDLEAQREIIPSIITKLNKTLTTASKIVKNEAEAMVAKKNILNNKRKTKLTENAIKRLEDREVKKFSEFEKLQEEYKNLYGELISRLAQFKSSVEIYFDDKPTQESESPKHPEEFLAAYRKVDLTESWKNLQNLDPTDTNTDLALKSFNHVCFDSHFQNLMLKEQEWLPEHEIENLKNSVQESVTGSSDQKETYDQLVVAHTACRLAKKAYKTAMEKEKKQPRKAREKAKILTGTITSEQLDTAKQLRMLHAQSVATNKTDHMNVDAKPDDGMDENNNHSLSSSDADSWNKAPAASDAEVPQENIDANITSGLHQESVTEKPQTFAKTVLPPIASNSSTTEISGVENQSNGRKLLSPITERSKKPKQKTSPERPTRPAPQPPSPKNTTSGGAKDQTDGSKPVPPPPPPPAPPLPSGNTTKRGGAKGQTDGSKPVPPPPPPPPRPPAPSAGSQTTKASSGVKDQDGRTNLLNQIREGKTLKKVPENEKSDRSAVNSKVPSQGSKGSIHDSLNKAIMQRGNSINPDASDGDDWN